MIIDVDEIMAKPKQPLIIKKCVTQAIALIPKKD
jgi:hypothetical protein